SQERAWALATAAYMSAFQADYEALAVLPDQARAVAEELGDPAALAYTQHVLGARELFGHDRPDTAIPLLTEALAAYAATDVPPQYSDSARVELAAAYIFSHALDKADAVIEQ